MRLALVSVSAVPAVIAGVAVALLLTGTTLNIQSFMGAIMAIGVAVANAILLTTFAEHNRLSGAAAVRSRRPGGGEPAAAHPDDQLRDARRHGADGPGPGEGGEQTAPLARAVIGGLSASTLATLLVLPSVFAVVQGRSSTASASLDPDDPESAYHDQPACDRAVQRPPLGAGCPLRRPEGGR